MKTKNVIKRNSIASAKHASVIVKFAVAVEEGYWVCRSLSSWVRDYFLPGLIFLGVLPIALLLFFVLAFSGFIEGLKINFSV